MRLNISAALCYFVPDSGLAACILIMPLSADVALALPLADLVILPA